MDVKQLGLYLISTVSRWWRRASARSARRVATVGSPARSVSGVGAGRRVAGAGGGAPAECGDDVPRGSGDEGKERPFVDGGDVAERAGRRDGARERAGEVQRAHTLVDGAGQVRLNAAGLNGWQLASEAAATTSSRRRSNCRRTVAASASSALWVTGVSGRSSTGTP